LSPRIPDIIRRFARRRITTLRARYHSRHGVFAVDIHGLLGLGARLVWCLEIAAYCDERRLTPRFRFTYPGSNKDYFSELFLIDVQRFILQTPFVRINSIIELDLRKDYNAALTLELASRLIKRYICVREDVLDEVEAFCEDSFGDKPVLGLHYRGTDKHRESPLIPYETIHKNLDRYLESFPGTEVVFVATDDMRFLRDIAKRRSDLKVVWREDAVRSADGTSVHEAANVDRSAVNRDALVNCLILSKCRALIKTPSILSAWSKIFNPDLPVLMLGRPYSPNLWFPERDLIRTNLFDPLE
jgi:hypothetical protein